MRDKYYLVVWIIVGVVVVVIVW